MLAGMWRKSRSKSWVWLSSPLTLFSTKSPHSLGVLSWRKKIQLLTYFLLILLWPSAGPSFLQVVLAQFLLPASVRMPTHLLSTSLSCLNCPLLHITSWFGHSVLDDLTSLSWSRHLILHPLGNKLACIACLGKASFFTSSVPIMMPLSFPGTTATINRGHTPPFCLPVRSPIFNLISYINNSSPYRETPWSSRPPTLP